MRPNLLLLLLLAVICGTHALSLSEETALEALFQNFSALASANPPWHANASSACEAPIFYGLTCSDGDDQHVLRLEFNIKGLSGTMPEALGGLEWLETLSIRNACISAALPPSVGRLAKLTSLELSETFCEGATPTDTSIPESIGDLAQLQTLSISLGTLSGSLPQSIGNLTSLEHLTISLPGSGGRSSRLAGYLPSTMDNLSMLKTLAIEGSQILGFERSEGGGSWHDLEEVSFANSLSFTGPVDALINGSPKLTSVDFTDTNIIAPNTLLGQALPQLTRLVLDKTPTRASITEFWDYHPQLRYFSASHCGVYGFISPSVSNMTQLAHLDLSYSFMSGGIPVELASCPLEFLSLSHTRIQSRLPSIFGDLYATMRYLDLSYMDPSSPSGLQSLQDFDQLEFLLLSSSGFTGIIPSGIGRNLYELRLDNNALVGTIPEFEGSKPLLFDVHSNQLYGSIPASVIARAIVVDLSYNNFNGTIAADLLLKSSAIQFSASHNQFSGPLPQIGSNRPSMIDLSFNQFEGEIPSSYCQCMRLDLSNNKLSGSLDKFVGDAQSCSLSTLSLSENMLNGSIPSLEKIPLRKLIISNNRFTGTLPRLPQDLQHFDASHNRFIGDNIVAWQSSSSVQNLTYLDISFNAIYVATSYTPLIGPGLKHLSVAYNHFGSIDRNSRLFASLTSLDATSTGGRGSFPLHLFPNLASLSLGSNYYTGDLALGLIPSLKQLDISHNEFSFEVSRFSAAPLLTQLSARYNKLYGDLSLDYMTNLQTADLSVNTLNQPPDLVSIGHLFRSGALKQLDIRNNPLLKNSFKTLDTPVTGLARTQFSAPAGARTTCYSTAFYNQTSRLFLYDDDMFTLAQCDCSPGYFGLPQDYCLSCPTQFADCGGTTITVSPNHYTFDIYRYGRDGVTSVAADAQRISDDLLLNALTKLSDLWTPIVAAPLNADLEANDSDSGIAFENARMRPWQVRKLETETCLVSTAQIWSGISNCHGFTETATPGNFGNAFKEQCANGSTGRLCSECICNTTAGDCWFWRDPVCVKCPFVLPLSVSISLAVGLFSLIMGTCIILSAVVLHFKRRQNLTSHSNLPKSKRFLARLLHLTTLGNVSILITFLQLLIAITEWNSYAKAKWLGLINGNFVGLGVNCIFPFFAAANLEQIFVVNLPYYGLIVTLVGVRIGGVIADRWERKQKEKKKAEREAENEAINGDASDDDTTLPLPSASTMDDTGVTTDSDTDATAADDSATDLEGEEGTPLLADSKLKKRTDSFDVTKVKKKESHTILDIQYPMKALMYSMTYSLFKFLYLGTALAAHQYLFSVTQYGTGLKYSAYKPWMLYSQSKPIINLSIPMILYADLFVPIMFVFMCLENRKRLGTWRTKIEYDTVFGNYTDQCFWWEAVNFFKKLTVALTLRGIPSSNAIQSALIVSILAGIMIVQQKLRPWRRKSENVMDGLSSLVLIGALLATRPGHLTHTVAVSFYIFALAIAFVLVSVGLILYHTITETPNSELRRQEVMLAAALILADDEDAVKTCVAVGLLPAK